MTPDRPSRPAPDRAPAHAAAPPPAAAPAVAGEHYENFPVASWLCPPPLRPPIAALYAFARTADDLADEGDAPPAERLAALAAYRRELAAALAGATSADPRWPQVFEPLGAAIARWRLPAAPLHHLLDAFEEDVRFTRDAAAYPDRAALLGYCRRSANPVGRLLLHLYGVDDARALEQSDAICSALQLANFWQDLSIDLPRGRFYLPLADCAAHGLGRADFTSFRPLARADPGPAAIELIAEEVRWTRALMHAGAPLVHRLAGRCGWELRLVVQGGLAILDKIEAQGFDSLSRRPTLGRADAPRLLWRALGMRRGRLRAAAVADNPAPPHAP